MGFMATEHHGFAVLTQTGTDTSVVAVMESVPEGVLFRTIATLPSFVGALEYIEYELHDDEGNLRHPEQPEAQPLAIQP